MHVDKHFVCVVKQNVVKFCELYFSLFFSMLTNFRHVIGHCTSADVESKEALQLLLGQLVIRGDIKAFQIIVTKQ